MPIVQNLIKQINSIIPKSEKELVLFDSMLYPDNIYTILNSYLTNKQKIKHFARITVFTASPEHYEKFNVECLNYPSIKALLRIMNAKYIITDMVFGDNYINPKSQIVIDVWHGVGLKKILGYTDECINRTRPFAKYTMSYSSFFNDVIARAFLVDHKNVITSGSPRNDMFYYKKREILDELIPGLSLSQKVFIWMPTYRQSTKAYSNNDGKRYEYGIPLINRDNIQELDSTLKRFNAFLIIKHHVLQDKQNQLTEKLTNIRIITSNDIKKTDKGLYEFIGQCDALITDYSSIYFEFMSLNKPICFAYDDLEEYNSKRGFMFENVEEIMPGCHSKTIGQLVQFIVDICQDNDKYKSCREDAISKMHLYNDNHNCERLLKAIGFIK